MRVIFSFVYFLSFLLVYFPFVFQNTVANTPNKVCVCVYTEGT